MDKRLGSIAVALVLTANCGKVAGQDLSGIKLAPGETLVAVDGKPVAGNLQQGVTTQNGAATPGTAAAAGSANIVGNLVPSNLPFSHSPGNTALEKANAERQRYGQRGLIPDPQLQALALQKATIAAQRRYKNHIGGSLGGAKCEGVGHTNGRFLSCCLDEPGTYGGAAMVQGVDGWYCCLLVR